MVEHPVDGTRQVHSGSSCLHGTITFQPKRTHFSEPIQRVTQIAAVPIAKPALQANVPEDQRSRHGFERCLGVCFTIRVEKDDFLLNGS